MIKIDFQLSPSWNRDLKQTDLASIDERRLRYDSLLGDVIFCIDNHDFSAPWGWVPILDFASSLKMIVDELHGSSTHAEFEFTESDSKIFFRLEGSRVCVGCTYAPGTAEVELDCLTREVIAFRDRLRNTITTEYPALLMSKAFRSLAGLEAI